MTIKSIQIGITAVTMFLLGCMFGSNYKATIIEHTEPTKIIRDTVYIDMLDTIEY